MPPKHQPDYPYLRHVRILRVHLFTGIQILSLAGMFAVKNVKSIAIIFPLLVVATSFVRKLMEKIFEQEELYWLDDILPGTKVGRIRRTSVARHVQLANSADEPKLGVNDGLATASNQSRIPVIVVEEECAGQAAERAVPMFVLDHDEQSLVTSNDDRLTKQFSSFQEEGEELIQRHTGKAHLSS